MPRAALYLRVSSDKQADNYSLPSQEQACRDWCASRDVIVDEGHVYREVYSAEDIYDRPELTDALDAVRAGDFPDILLSYDLDRFVRDDIQLAVVADLLRRHDVQLRFVTQEFDDTDVGGFLRQTLAWVAKFERTKIIERTSRGSAARLATRRHYPGGRAPYGYQWVDGTSLSQLVQDPIEAPVVRRIYCMYSSGTAVRAVATVLSADGIPTPGGGGRWDGSTVRYILRNPVYYGCPVANRWQSVKIDPGPRTRNPRVRGKRRVIRARGTGDEVALTGLSVEAIVDRAAWDTVQVRLGINKQLASRNSRHPQAVLLRGFVFCGTCGRRLHAHPPGGNRTVWEYVCDHGRRGVCTDPSAIRAPLLDDYVWTEFVRRVSCVDLAKWCRADYGKSAEQIAQLKAIERQLSELAADEHHILALVTDRRLSDDQRDALYGQLQSLAVRKEAAQRAYAVLQDRHSEATRQAQAKQLAAAQAAISGCDCSWDARRRLFVDFKLHVVVMPANGRVAPTANRVQLHTDPAL